MRTTVSKVGLGILTVITIIITVLIVNLFLILFTGCKKDNNPSIRVLMIDAPAVVYVLAPELDLLGKLTEEPASPSMWDVIYDK